MANYYQPLAPNGANDGDVWTNQTTGEVFMFAGGGWVSQRPHATVGGTPAAAAGANAGSSPPAPVVAGGSTDARGQLSFGSGTTPGALRLVDVTFAKPYPAMPFVAVNAANSAAVALSPYVATQNANGFTIGALTAPPGSQANTVFRVNYGVIG